MIRSSYVTPVITTLFIYLYLNCVFQHSNCAKLDFNQLLRRRHLKDGQKQDNNVIQMLRLLRDQNLDYDSSQQRLDDKRYGIGFGTDRAFSASQAARHILGQDFANKATNPGRRRKRRSFQLLV